MQMKSGPMGLCAAAILGVIGLCCFGVHVWKSSAPRSELYYGLDHSEPVAIYAPPALFEFAGTRPDFRSHRELVEALKAMHLDDAWYAVSWRNYHRGGKPTDLMIVYHPIEHEHDFAMTLCVLDKLVGKDPGPEGAAFDNANIVLADREFTNRPQSQ